MILPIDGAQACRPISINRKKLEVVREEGKIVNHGNIRKWMVLFGKQNIPINGIAILGYK